MRRRTLLATVGATFSAGCSDSIPLLDSEKTATDADTDTPPNPDAPPEAPPTATDEPTPEPTETERTTDEPRPAEREAARVLASAREKLGEAHANYVAVADAENATLLDVTVASDVNVSGVAGPVNAARKTLDDLPRRAAGDQITTARQLRGVATFYEKGVRAQSALGDAYGEFEYVVGQLYAGQTGLITGSIDEMRANRRTAAGYLETVESETSPEDATALDALGGETYTAKLDQLRRSVSAFETLPDTLARVQRGFDAFRRGGETYLEERYFESERALGTARSELRPASDALASLAVPAPMTDAVDDLAAVSDTLAVAAVDLEAAAEAGTKGAVEDRRAAFADAQAHLENATVAPDRLEIVRRLLEK